MPCIWYGGKAVGSVEIVGVEVDVDALHALHLLGADRGDAVLVLQHAVDDQERLLDDDQPIAREQIGPDDDVGDAGFVLEREEDEALWPCPAAGA